EEIERAKPRVGEDTELEMESKRLSHASELARLAESLHSELYASERSLAARLAETRRTLDQLARSDPSLEPWREVVENALYGLEAGGRGMGEYAAGVEDAPARLEEVRSRFDLLFRFQRKYGPGLDDVIRTAADARAELDALDGSALDRDAIEKEIDDAE